MKPQDDMTSEVVENGERRSPKRLHKFNPLSLLRRLVRPHGAVNADYDPAAEKKRLLGQAFSCREQEAYQRAVDLEREAYESAVSTSGASLAGAYRDLETATGIVRDSSVREARRLGRIFYDVRQKNNVTRFQRPSAV